MQGGGPGGGGFGGGPRGRGGAPAGPVPVEIAVAVRTPLLRSTLVAGTLEPLRTVGVTSLLAGTLLSIRAEEGTRVSAGDTLAELDTRELRAQLRSAEANLALTKGNEARSAALLRDRVITQAEYERDRAAYAASEANVEQLRTRLGFASITAPVTGVVATKSAETGDVISGQTQLFTIAMVETLVARLAVSELDVVALREGASVPITVDALGGAEVVGRIRRIFPTADVATRMIPVEVAIGGRALPGLKPGFTIRARLALDEAREAVTIPTRALQGGASSRYLFVLAGNKAHRRTVRAGDDVDGRSEVFSGLAEGDTVIVAGNAMLRDGGTVRVVQPLRNDTTAAVSRVERQ
jgi:membrane fusion protein (multidrug efflux system)